MRNGHTTARSARWKCSTCCLWRTGRYTVRTVLGASTSRSTDSWSLRRFDNIYYIYGTLVSSSSGIIQLLFQYKNDDLEECLKNFSETERSADSDDLEDYEVDISKLPPSLRYL